MPRAKKEEPIVEIPVTHAMLMQYHGLIDFLPGGLELELTATGREIVPNYKGVKLVVAGLYKAVHAKH